MSRKKKYKEVVHRHPEDSLKKFLDSEKNSRLLIAVIGGNKCTKEVENIAYDLGKNIAKLNAILVTGGLGGVMEAVSCGAKEQGGLTIGILPGAEKRQANSYIDIAIPTGLGLSRNTLVVRSADIVIALPGKYGTLSEIAFSLILKKKVLNLSNWDIPGTIRVDSVEKAINELKRLL